MSCNWCVAKALVISLLALPTLGWAKSELDLRITRLENIVHNEINISLLNQLDSMQQEIRELRGKVEEQQHALELTNQKQEKLFLNLDTRVNTLGGTPLNPIEEPTLPPTTNSIKPKIAKTPKVVELKPAPITAPNIEVDADLITAFDMEPPLKPATQVITEKSAFNTAYSNMHSKRYEDAIMGFKDYVWQFPEGESVASAYYWLGEIYLLQWQQTPTQGTLLEQAKEFFSVVTTKYPNSPKEMDALLKLGLIEIDLNNPTAARQLLQEVIAKQPNSSHAHLAENQLKALQKAL